MLQIYQKPVKELAKCSTTKTDFVSESYCVTTCRRIEEPKNIFKQVMNIITERFIVTSNIPSTKSSDDDGNSADKKNEVLGTTL